MVAAAWLAGAGALQAACSPTSPAPAPMSTAASSIRAAAAMAALACIEPWSLPSRGTAWSSSVACGGGFDVVHRPAAAPAGDGDRESSRADTATGAAGDGLANLHGKDHRRGCEVTDLLGYCLPRCRLGPLLGGCGGGGGTGQGTGELAGGHGREPGQPGAGRLAGAVGAVGGGEPGRER